MSREVIMHENGNGWENGSRHGHNAPLWPIFSIFDFWGSEPPILAASLTRNHPNSVGDIALSTREPVGMAGEEKKGASLNGTEVPCW